MKSDSGLTTSVWQETYDVGQGPALGEDKQTDVCIIGAGIAGLTTAYMLTEEGRSVIVLDDGPVAGGETSRTTAHLSNAIDDRYFEIERLHGEQGALTAAASH
ncbi:MAG TPA: FAD-binding oxidoreductase, partial [Blastocatellia bacterium]|nr:FAD-binding oxidoreductase [Blastocatellia bacterium]